MPITANGFKKRMIIIWFMVYLFKVEIQIVGSQSKALSRNE